MISADLLAPHPDIHDPLRLWLRVPRRLPVVLVHAIKSGRMYLWFAGFSGIEALRSGQVEVRVFRQLPDGYLDKAWSEAACADGVRDFGVWYRALLDLLPEEQAIRLIGPRGITKYGAARFARVSRQTFYNGLREDR
jgi:hypothetical protein